MRNHEKPCILTNVLKLVKTQMQEFFELLIASSLDLQPQTTSLINLNRKLTLKASLRISFNVRDSDYTLNLRAT